MSETASTSTTTASVRMQAPSPWPASGIGEQGLDLRRLQVGDALLPLRLPPVDRALLAAYAEASNDRNPIHLDAEAARRGGLPDVIAHGMLSMAWLGRLLTQWTAPGDLREFGVRFAGITHLGECITCTALVVEREDVQRTARLRLAVQTTNQNGEVKLTGHAVISLPEELA